MTLAAASLLLGACGHTAAASAGDRAATEEQLRQLYSQIAGSVEQRRAQEWLVYATAQERQLTCGGSTTTTTAFEDPYAGMTRIPLPAPFPAAADAQPAWAAVHGFGVFESVLARADHPTSSAWPNITPTARPAPSTFDCTATAPEAAGLPSFTEPLLTDLYSVLSESAAAADVKGHLDGYAACMDEHRVPADDPVTLNATISESYAQFISTHDTAGRRPTGTTWDNIVAAEKAAAVADASCRQDAHAQYLDQIAQRLDTFTLKHDQAVNAVGAQWKSLLETSANKAATVGH